jgi:hypothetical protein
LLFSRQFAEGLDLIRGDYRTTIVNRLVDSSEPGRLLVYPQAFSTKLLACLIAELREDHFPLLLDDLGDLFLEEMRIESCPLISIF